MSMRVVQTPTIYYTREAATKCLAWCHNAGRGRENSSPSEVGWIGRVRLVGAGFWITDVEPLVQSASGAEFTATPEEISRFYEQLILLHDSGDTSRGLPIEWTHFGHSHAQMKVFQSSIDRENVEERFSRKPYCVAVTWNAAGDTYGEITIFQPFAHRIDTVPVVIAWADDAIYEREAERIKALVRPSYEKFSKQSAYIIKGGGSAEENSAIRKHLEKGQFINPDWDVEFNFEGKKWACGMGELFLYDEGLDDYMLYRDDSATKWRAIRHLRGLMAENARRMKKEETK